MHLFTKFNRSFTELAVYTGTIIRLLLHLLMLVILVALAIGVYKSGHDLWMNINKPLEVLLQNILVDIVFIVALVEIAITILGYLKDGKVHVRYIVDTILIIMLNEIVGLWFTKPKPAEAATVTGIVLALAVVRVMVTRLAPRDENL
ncbi:MAG TPA: phosphate-starvation-inducible PsiE family protein [Candidatus Limnocylindrales bacterium]|nr:phosphate-starvation-inducible PsiE family protein [Candidatus Limnocylindrales bacterium]